MCASWDAQLMASHKTESIYRRYAIADAAMLREGAAKLAAFSENARTATRKIVPIEERAKRRVEQRG